MENETSLPVRLTSHVHYLKGLYFIIWVAHWRRGTGGKYIGRRHGGLKWLSLGMNSQSRVGAWCIGEAKSYLDDLLFFFIIKGYVVSLLLNLNSSVSIVNSMKLLIFCRKSGETWNLTPRRYENSLPLWTRVVPFARGIKHFKCTVIIIPFSVL